MAKDDFTIEFDNDNNTNIAFGTTADYAYTLWLAKKKQIADLEYECELLKDKYFREIKNASISYMFQEQHIKDMFSKDEGARKLRDAARELFLENGFSPDFLKAHKVEFVNYNSHGYTGTAMGVVLGIGDYEYTMEFPQPQNIRDEKDKKLLMGQVKFRVDRIHKSKLNEFVKQMEPVQMPTYDWKECFKAIETIVAKEK